MPPSRHLVNLISDESVTIRRGSPNAVLIHFQGSIKWRRHFEEPQHVYLHFFKYNIIQEKTHNTVS